MDINNYFHLALEKGASDVHLIGGEPPALRVNGRLVILDESELDPADLLKTLEGLLTEQRRERLYKEQELDIAWQFNEARFRFNLHWQRGRIGLTARLIPTEIPKPEDIQFNETLYNLTHLNQGLVLVTGPTGCGKSTTLAVMVDIINKERPAHVVTIEDPIEFIYKRKQSLIEQRELGVDTRSFAGALKHTLRQDPNVILVGEMRDLETVHTALVAAETGHLVLSTLHTNSAASTVERIVSLFPSAQHDQVLIQLAANLRAAIAQQLLPTKDGKRIAVREILIGTPAIGSLIRKNAIMQIPSTIQTSRKHGMITTQQAIQELWEQGVIDEQTAKNRMGDIETGSTYY